MINDTLTSEQITFLLLISCFIACIDAQEQKAELQTYQEL